MRVGDANRRAARSVSAMAFLAAGAVVLAVLAACTGGGGETAGGVSADIRGTTLTVFAPQGPDQDLATNSATAAVKNALGIDITWQTTTYNPVNAEQERLDSLAGGDLPDVYLLITWVNQFSQLELQEYGRKGVIVPLNDLIDTYAPNVTKAFADTPAWKRLSTAPDGKIYGLAQWNDCFHCSYWYKLWMNSAWLRRLGLQQPKTTEDLRRVLRAFKTQDPNGNGKADEIPLTGLSNSDEGGLIPYLMNAFVYYPAPARPDRTPLVLDNGKVQFQPAQDAYRKGLEYIASLYAEGLIDKAAFTQSYGGLKAEGEAAGAVLVGAAATLHPANIVNLGQPDGRDRQYDAVPPLTGPDGVSNAVYEQPGLAGGVFVITSKATRIEQIAAVKLLDYLVGTQGHLRAEFGEEGRSWVKPAAGDQALDPSLSPLFKRRPWKPNDKPRNDAWGPIAQLYSPASFRNAEVQPMDIYSPDGNERRLFQATKLYAGREPRDQIFPGSGLWLNEADAADITQLQADLQEYVAQSQFEFITGQRKLDAISWSTYLDGLRDLGLQRYLGLMQKAYDADVRRR
jgi:putative aldouronate transport system substrate-binding protein